MGTLTITAIYVAIANIPVLSRPILAVTKKEERVGARTEVIADRIKNPVYIADGSVKDFQPMGANLGILPPLFDPPRDKKLKAAAYAERSLKELEKLLPLGTV